MNNITIEILECSKINLELLNKVIVPDVEMSIKLLIRNYFELYNIQHPQNYKLEIFKHSFYITLLLTCNDEIKFRAIVFGSLIFQKTRINTWNVIRFYLLKQYGEITIRTQIRRVGNVRLRYPFNKSVENITFDFNHPVINDIEKLCQDVDRIFEEDLISLPLFCDSESK